MQSTKSTDLIGHIKFQPWQQLSGCSVTRSFLFGVACETNSVHFASGLLLCSPKCVFNESVGLTHCQCTTNQSMNHTSLKKIQALGIVPSEVLYQFSYCVGWIAANTRPHQMCWGGRQVRDCLVSCPPRVPLLARNGLVNEVEFLGLIPQNGGRPMRLRDR